MWTSVTQEEIYRQPIKKTETLDKLPDNDLGYTLLELRICKKDKKNASSF